MKIKLFKIALILLLIFNLYNNFLKYHIENNPLRNFSADDVSYIYITKIIENKSYDSDMIKDKEKNKKFFEYLKNLKLMQIIESPLSEDSIKNRYSISIGFKDNDNNHIYINGIHKNEDPITFEISYKKSNTKHFKNYKVINKDLKYKDLEKYIDLYAGDYKNR